MFFLPIYGNQYSVGSPQLRYSLLYGQPPRKRKTAGTSFLPTATAWDFSPPPLPSVLPGTTPYSRVVPAEVGVERRADLRVDSPLALPVHLPFHLTYSPDLPFIQNNHLFHPPSVALPLPRKVL